MIFSKHIITFSFLFLTSLLFSQPDSTQNFGSGGGSVNESIYDSIPTVINEKIQSFLESRGVESDFRNANFQNEKYLLIVPLKKDGVILVIWSDYHFNSKGECVLVRTTFASMDDVDCNAVGEKFCSSIFKLYLGYEKEFDIQYNDYFYFFEKASGSYFEVFHPDRSIDSKVMFSEDGVRLSSK